MDPSSEKISEQKSGTALLGTSTDYQARAIFFAQAVLASARAFPSTLTPQIPLRDWEKITLRVKEAAEFLIAEGVMAPRFAPRKDDRPEVAV